MISNQDKHYKHRYQFLFLLFLIINLLFINCAPMRPKTLKKEGSSSVDPTPTPTPNPSPSPSGSPLPTPSQSPSPSPSGSPPPTPSQSPTPSPTQSPSPSPSPVVACPAGNNFVNGANDITTPPTLDSQNRRYFKIGTKPFFPIGTYGFAFNMLSNQDKHSADSSGKTLRQAIEERNKTHLDLLANNGLNFTRYWINWGAVTNTENTSEDWDKHLITPYQRNGPGNASDNRPKLDLTKFNNEYFEMLSQFVDYAKSKGIVLQLIMLDCWHSGQFGERFGYLDRDFYKGNNNINGLNFTSRDQWFATSGNIWNHHKSFIRKVIDTIGSRPNIIWDTCNENTQSQEFDEAIANEIRAYESSKGFSQHLIVGRTASSANNIEIPEHMRVAGHKTPADKSSQSIEQMRESLANTQYAWSQPLITDNDCCGGQPSAHLVRRKAWMALTGGGYTSLFNSESYTKFALNSENTTLYTKYLGHVKKLLNAAGTNLPNMRPAPNDNTIVKQNVAYALYKPNSDFIVYFPYGGTSFVNGLPSRFRSVWYDPREDVLYGAGSGPNFTTPDSRDWVLYIQDTSQFPTCQQITNPPPTSYQPPHLAFTKTLSGLVHKVTQNPPYEKVLTFSVPPNRRFRKLEAEIDVKIPKWSTGWQGDNNKRWHMVLWLQRSRSWQSYSPQFGNVLSYINLIPRSGYVEVNSQTNIHGNAPHQMFQISGNSNISEGNTYHFHVIYDAESGKITTRILKAGSEVFSMTGPAYTAFLDTLSSGEFLLGVGHKEFEEGPECPSIDWEYSNFEVRLYE